MKQRDIRTGVVYALKATDRHKPIAAAVVATNPRYGMAGMTQFTAVDGSVYRERVQIVDGTELLCVLAKSGANVSEAELISAAAGCSLPEVDSVFNRREDMSSLLVKQDPRMFVSILPAKTFEGPYDDATWLRNAKLRDEHDARNRVESERIRLHNLVSRLSELTGVPDLAYGISDDNYEVMIRAKSLEAVVDRIEAFKATNPLSDGAL